jgi:hypothetical protein
MNYEEFLDNYTPELQLIDALDRVKEYCPIAAATIDRWVSQPNNEKTDEASLQKDPTQ